MLVSMRCTRLFQSIPGLTAKIKCIFRVCASVHACVRVFQFSTVVYVFGSEGKTLSSQSDLGHFL